MSRLTVPRVLRSPRGRFLLRFAILLAVLYVVIALRPVDAHIVTPFSRGVTAASASVLNLGGDPVLREGTILRSNRFAVDVKNGCNGIEAILLLVAAMLAYPARWRDKGVGIVAGVLLIQIVNLVRVTSLYVIGRDHPALFDAFHVTVWQVVIFVLTIGIFVFWSGRVGREPIPASA